MPLLQQLSNGEIAIKNDGTVEELNRVLDHCFKDDLKTNGRALYYYAVNKKWDCDYSVNLPAYSVKDFIAEMDFALPEKWCVRGCVELYNYFNGIGEFLDGYNSSHIYYIDNGIWYSKHINTQHSEITFDQFKKYVLKEDEKKLNVDLRCDIANYDTLLKPKDQYAVMLTDSGAPTKLHDTYESAKKECLRLVKETKRDGYVLKVVSKISNQIKIEKV